MSRKTCSLVAWLKAQVVVREFSQAYYAQLHSLIALYVRPGLKFDYLMIHAWLHTCRYIWEESKAAVEPGILLTYLKLGLPGAPQDWAQTTLCMAFMNRLVLKATHEWGGLQIR